MTGTVRFTAMAASIAAALTLASCSADKPISCPTPQLQAASGDLHETAADIAHWRDRFTNGTIDDAIGEAVNALEAKYPKAGRQQVYNYLVAAYCPIAAKRTESQDLQKSKLEHFETQLRGKLGI